jgi:hypothetical protein
MQCSAQRRPAWVAHAYPTASKHLAPLQPSLPPCPRSALHSATRGSDQLLSGVLALLVRYHVKVPLDLSPSHAAYPGAVAALAAFGFYVQLSCYFRLPFPFNVLLMPLRLFEVALAWTLAYGPK